MKTNAGSAVQTTACSARNATNVRVGCWWMASVSLIMAAGNQGGGPLRKDQKQATALYATTR